jgi:hypothetical protein
MAALFLFPHMVGQISCRLPVISRRLLERDWPPNLIGTSAFFTCLLVMNGPDAIPALKADRANLFCVTSHDHL